ncbi:NAD(P)-dependent glycerol-1-phosphate dehydrogenase [Thermosphaera sp.]
MHSVHEITLPLKVIVGHGVVEKVSEIIPPSVRKVGIITGELTYELSGKRIEEALASERRVVVWKAPNAMVDTAEEIAKKAREERVEVVIGVGGGKAIDVAKYVAKESGSLMISVPTTPSHDGIASPFASLKGTGKPTSIYTKTPYGVIADVEIIGKAPRRLIMAGFGDLVGKLVAVKDWALAHRLRGEYYGEYAAQLALMSAKHVLRYHELIASGSAEGVRILVEALVSSGVAMCIAGSSRPASGSEHLFSHALDIVAPGRALHGEQVALGAIMMLYLHGDSSWRKVRRILRKVGLPTTAQEIGVEPEKIVEALTIAHTIRPDRYTILGEKGLTREAAYRLARETGVI